MKIILKISLVISVILFLSCNMTTKEYLEQELGIKLFGKINFQVEEEIDMGFTGDFTRIKVYNIKDNFYKEIEQAAEKKDFIRFDNTKNLPFTDNLFSEYIENGSGLYKYYEKEFKEYRLIILNEKTKQIIYYLCYA